MSRSYSYYSFWALEVVTSSKPKIYDMTKEMFFSEYIQVATSVINAEKHTLVPPDQLELLHSGQVKKFSIARGYTSEEITDYLRLFYLMGRERRPQFKIDGKTYNFDNVPLSRYGKSNNGKGSPRPSPEWLWEQWLLGKTIPEAKYY